MNSFVFDTGGGPNGLKDLIRLEHESERRALKEEWQDRRRRVVFDWERVRRRARVLQEELAPTMLSAKELSTWKKLQSHHLFIGHELRKAIATQRRLAPEATPFEDRMDAILLKNANLPLGVAAKLTMNQYWSVLDVAAEAIEQAAYPGSADARKRYALALRRCAQDMRDSSVFDDQVAAQARWRACMTIQLSLDDGTLGLWNSSQALVDFVGLKDNGTSQDAKAVSKAAWTFMWDYAVVSRLRQLCPQQFMEVADNRTYQTDEAGRILDNRGQPLVWTWDGMGSGTLNGEAALNTEAERAFQAAIEETGISRLLSAPNWEDSYKKSPEYYALREKEIILYEGTTTLACEALADILDQGLYIRSPTFIAPVKWHEMNDENFERLIYSLISGAPGYSNVQWLTHTNASDRGRDISAIKTISHPLTGDRQFRVIIQCKHWLKHSIGTDEVTKLVGQMNLWTPPPVDELIIATSGRFSSDAVQWIEKHNQDRRTPWIDMWPNSHLESLLCGKNKRN